MNNDLLQILLARHENQYVTGLIYFFYDNIMYIYRNMFHRELNRGFCANNFLFYEAIHQGLQQNCQMIVFGLTPSNKTSGLCQFKKKWGEVPITLVFVEKTSVKSNELSKLKKLVSRLH